MWKGNLVGQVRDAKIDMFHLYGSWEPVSGTDYEEFLSSLDFAETSVVIGSMKGVVHEAPSQHEIEITFILPLNSTRQQLPVRWRQRGFATRLS